MIITDCESFFWGHGRYYSLKSNLVSKVTIHSFGHHGQYLTLGTSWLVLRYSIKTKSRLRLDLCSERQLWHARGGCVSQLHISSCTSDHQVKFLQINYLTKNCFEKHATKNIKLVAFGLFCCKILHLRKLRLNCSLGFSVKTFCWGIFKEKFPFLR